MKLLTLKVLLERKEDRNYVATMSGSTESGHGSDPMMALQFLIENIERCDPNFVAHLKDKFDETPNT